MAPRLRRTVGVLFASVAILAATSHMVAATERFQLVTTIDVTFQGSVAVLGERAYVASTAEISVIDTTSNTIEKRIPIAGVTQLNGAAAIAGKVYFAASGSNQLVVLDTATDVVTYFDTTDCLRPFSLLPVGTNRLVVNCHNSANIQVIDVTGPTKIQTVATGGGPRGMSFFGSRVFVPNSGANTMSIVDISLNPATVTNVNVGRQPEFTAYLDGKIFVANFHNTANSVSIIDATSATVIATVAVGNEPQGIAPCAGNVYTANRWTGNTSVISPISDSVINTITLAGVGAITHVMGVNGDFAYFLNNDRASVSVVDCTTQTVAATVGVASAPGSIAFSSQYAYVGGDNKVSVIAITSGGSGSATMDGQTQRAPDIIQQIGRTPEDDCTLVDRPDLDWTGATGPWGPSWAEWAVPVTGGLVCTRTLVNEGPGRWVVRS